MKAVEAIGKNGFNLRALKSRPTKETNWEYYFYAEGDGTIADKSGSMSSDMTTMQNIMSEFVQNMDFAIGDAAELIAFDSYIMYMCTYTKDPSLLQNGIFNMTASGDTALYDAIMAGITNASYQQGARCVIAFTDGEDNRSTYTPEEIVNSAVTKDVPVYIIEDMVGHKLGEFAPTRTFRGHAGSEKSSSSR